MPTFTLEQRNFLDAMDKLYKGWFEVHQRLIRELYMEVGALKGVVIDRDLMREEELETAIKEAKAFIQLEMDSSPELQGLEDKWNRLRRILGGSSE